MTRFFVSPEEMGENFLVLTGENAAHAKVLRLKTGDMVTVCDGQGRGAVHGQRCEPRPRVSLIAHHWGTRGGEVVRCGFSWPFPRRTKLGM